MRRTISKSRRRGSGPRRRRSDPRRRRPTTGAEGAAGPVCPSADEGEERPTESSQPQHPTLRDSLRADLVASGFNPEAYLTRDFSSMNLDEEEMRINGLLPKDDVAVGADAGSARTDAEADEENRWMELTEEEMMINGLLPKDELSDGDRRREGKRRRKGTKKGETEGRDRSKTRRGLGGGEGGAKKEGRWRSRSQSQPRNWSKISGWRTKDKKGSENLHSSLRSHQDLRGSFLSMLSSSTRSVDFSPEDTDCCDQSKTRRGRGGGEGGGKKQWRWRSRSRSKTRSWSKIPGRQTKDKKGSDRSNQSSSVQSVEFSTEDTRSRKVGKGEGRNHSPGKTRSRSKTRQERRRGKGTRKKEGSDKRSHRSSSVQSKNSPQKSTYGSRGSEPRKGHSAWKGGAKGDGGNYDVVGGNEDCGEENEDENNEESSVAATYGGNWSDPMEIRTGGKGDAEELLEDGGDNDVAGGNDDCGEEEVEGEDDDGELRRGSEEGLRDSPNAADFDPQELVRRTSEEARPMPPKPRRLSSRPELSTSKSGGVERASVDDRGGEGEDNLVTELNSCGINDPEELLHRDALIASASSHCLLGRIYPTLITEEGEKDETGSRLTRRFHRRSNGGTGSGDNKEPDSDGGGHKSKQGEMSKKSKKHKKKKHRRKHEDRGKIKGKREQDRDEDDDLVRSFTTIYSQRCLGRSQPSLVDVIIARHLLKAKSFLSTLKSEGFDPTPVLNGEGDVFTEAENFLAMDPHDFVTESGLVVGGGGRGGHSPSDLQEIFRRTLMSAQTTSKEDLLRGSSGEDISGNDNTQEREKKRD